MLPLFFSIASPIPKKVVLSKPKIRVHTMRLPESAPKTASPVTQKIAAAPPKPKAATLPPKETPKKPAAKKSSPKPIDGKKKAIAELEKKLETLSAPLPEVKKSSWTVPSFQRTPSPVVEEERGSHYGAALFTFLSQSLQLPDYGKVTVKLRLSPKGKVLKLEVLESLSEKNETYLKQTLPKLLFPPPERGMLQEKEEELILTFSNQL